MLDFVCCSNVMYYSNVVGFWFPVIFLHLNSCATVSNGCSMQESTFDEAAVNMTSRLEIHR